MNQNEIMNRTVNNISDQNRINNPNYINRETEGKFNNVIPEFSKQELKGVVISDRIAKEIKMEKYRIAFIIFSSLIALFISVFFIAVYYSADTSGNNFLKIDPALVPSAGIMITILVISLIFLLMSLIQSKHISIDVKRYKSELLMGRERIPFFILKNYKKIVKKHIYLNWISFSIYLYGGISIAIMFLIKNVSNVQVDTEIIIFIVILTLTAIIQIFSLIFNYTRKGNIDSFYGYEIVPLEQQLALKKAANKVCMIFFFTILAIILFVVFIPYFILRKKNGKKLWWFI